jgi:hypothetical protein
VYVASLDGELFAMHELNGSQRWKYSTGFPVTRAAAGVGERVFVTSGEPALHCVHATTGAGLWEAPGVVQFAAASRDRVYGVNDFGAFVVLNAATGAILARVASDRPAQAMVNDQTDRIYLISQEGMVECFHETGLKEPLYHNPKPEPKIPPGEKPAASPTATPAPTEKAPAKPEAAFPDEKPMGQEMEEKPPEKKNDFGVEENPFG